MEGVRAVGFSSITKVLTVPTVLLIAGGVLFLSGHGLFAASFFQGVNGAVVTIPAGPQWFLAYEMKVLGASRVFGRFAAPAGGLVEVFVFNATQRDSFAVRGFGPSLYSAQAASGSFSANLPGAGIYYLVLGHGDGSLYSGQAILVSYRVAGIQPALFDVSVPFIVAGIAAVGLGLWQRNRRDDTISESGLSS